MKKLIATVCFVGSALALSACSSDGSGYVDSGPPYAMERTAGGTQDATQPAPRRAEETFSRSQVK